MAPRKKKQAAGSQEPEIKDRCVWTVDDENMLVDFIEANKARAGDGVNFDRTFWIEAAAHLAESTSKGAVKTAEACSSKWSRVSRYPHVPSAYDTDTPLAPWHIYHRRYISQ